MRQNKPYTKPGEAWEDIYPGYAISNQGRWYSYKRKQILKQFKNSSGYYRVYIHLDGSSKALFTHIKVVEVFGDKNGNKIPKDAESLVGLRMSIDHVDANKKHNSQSNLELVTHQENCRRREIQKKTGGQMICLGTFYVSCGMEKNSIFAARTEKFLNQWCRCTKTNIQALNKSSKNKKNCLN